MIYHYGWFIKSHFYIKAMSENDRNKLSKHYLVMKKVKKKNQATPYLLIIYVIIEY